MGYTRSRRYANYKGGIKYDKTNDYSLNARGTGDPEKVLSARIFFGKWKEAEDNQKYKTMKSDWKKQYG